MQETLLNIRKVGYNDDDPEADIVFTETQGKSWTIAGVYPFVVPPDVFFLCGVAIGGGGPSYSKGPEGGNWGTGGGGGGAGGDNGAIGRGARGGGTGLFGQGNNGAVATGPNKPGGHGSYSFGTGAFGGGGSLGCLGPNAAVKVRQGAVRVIWAVGSQVRAFPSNNVGRI